MKISESLILEPLSEHHAKPVFDLIDKNREYLKSWLQWVEHIHSEADFRNFLEGVRVRIAANQARPYFIRFEGKIAGNTGLYHFDYLNKIAAIGYWLGEEFQGQGIITEACRAIIKHGFTDLGLNRIELKCGTGNIRSKAIAERLGFTQEGILRQAEFLNGNFHDLYLYSLLKQEWERNS